MSGAITQQLSSRATSAGARGVESFASAGTSGRYPGNTSRDLLRSMLKNSDMPPLYWAQVPMKEPKSGQHKVLTWMPFLLPHEVLANLWKTFGRALYEPSSATEKVLERSCLELGVDKTKETILPLGVHGDGVPNQANKTVVAFTWNLLCKEKSERILFASLNKDS